MGVRLESIKFIFIGILNTIVGFGVYALLLKFVTDNYFITLLISHIIGVAHSYLWNNKWTFKQKKIFEYKTALRFLIVYSITFLFNFFFLYGLVNFNLINNKFYAQAIALFFTTLISFSGHKFWTFKKS